jgi:hypothetical protein
VNIAVCYIAVTHGPITSDYCARFVASYHEFPPGVEHDLIVCCNGGKLPTATALIFSPLKAAMFLRANTGQDIGGYMDAARGPAANCDMLVCLGESVHFHRAGWLKRLVEVWEHYGPGMYGPFASNMIRAHLNTSAFCCPPKSLLAYPSSWWGNGTDRYAMEHGPKAFWRWMATRGKAVRLVTWDGDYDCRSWRSPPNILWRGDQSNCLMWCNHASRWAEGTHRIRETWSRGADAPFK